MNSTSISINLPIVSGMMEKKCTQDIFVGPSFIIAERQLSPSMRSDTSEAEDCPFPHVKENEEAEEHFQMSWLIY